MSQKMQIYKQVLQLYLKCLLTEKVTNPRLGQIQSFIVSCFYFFSGKVLSHKFANIHVGSTNILEVFANQKESPVHLYVFVKIC